MVIVKQEIILRISLVNHNIIYRYYTVLSAIYEYDFFLIGAFNLVV